MICIEQSFGENKLLLFFLLVNGCGCFQKNRGGNYPPKSSQFNRVGTMKFSPSILGGGGGTPLFLVQHPCCLMTGEALDIEME